MGLLIGGQGKYSAFSVRPLQLGEGASVERRVGLGNERRGDDWTLAGCIQFVCFSLTSFPVTAFGDSCDFGEAKPIALGWDT